MSKTMSTPNFDKLAQSTAVFILLLICENRRIFELYLRFPFDLLIVAVIGILLRRTKFKFSSFKRGSHDPFPIPIYIWTVVKAAVFLPTVK